jgi:hypothetical protein
MRSGSGTGLPAPRPPVVSPQASASWATPPVASASATVYSITSATGLTETATKPYNARSHELIALFDDLAALGLRTYLTRVSP